MLLYSWSSQNLSYATMHWEASKQKIQDTASPKFVWPCIIFFVFWQGRRWGHATRKVKNFRGLVFKGFTQDECSLAHSVPHRWNILMPWHILSAGTTVLTLFSIPTERYVQGFTEPNLVSGPTPALHIPSSIVSTHYSVTLKIVTHMQFRKCKGTRLSGQRCEAWGRDQREKMHGNQDLWTEAWGWGQREGSPCCWCWLTASR